MVGHPPPTERLDAGAPPCGMAAPMTDRRLELAEAALLVRPEDTLLCGFAGGQPAGLLEAIGARRDLEHVRLFTGLLTRPYAFLQNPGIEVLSGFFGPMERLARSMGARVQYLPGDFHGLERLALRTRPRVVLAVVSPPDADGWVTFGTHAGASFTAFLEAARDPERLALAEVNRHMPRVRGLAALGGHRVRLADVDGWVEHDAELVALPASEVTATDRAIATHVIARVPDGATLQFGIGAVPDEIAHVLAEGSRGDFGIHTEMLSDGVMRLHRHGKVANQKGLYDGTSVATFALGSADLYRWLDDNPDVALLPVSAVNEPSLLRRLHRFVSVNAALAVDLRGQIAADHVGGRQYSGVGGHESFVMGASEAPGGNSFVCLPSTVTVGGKRISTIVAHLPDTMTVTTPRHHTQWVVTEHGAVDLSLLGDVERARALVEIAHPDFRDELRAAG